MFKLNIVGPRKVCVLTPSMDRDGLYTANQSVANQTHKDIEHLIVYDGVVPNKRTVYQKSKNIVLPYNTGGGGFYGHRIYASIPLLLDFDYVFLLDEDNWYDENHVESLIELIENKNLDWAYSLRKVYTDPKTFLANDNCESIGKYPIWFTVGKEEQYLVDTSTFAFRGSVLKNYCLYWYSGWGGDRRFYNSIKNSTNYDTTGLHTMNYVLPDMQKAYGGDYEFFKKGNEFMLQHYGGKYPWQT